MKKKLLIIVLFMSQGIYLFNGVANPKAVNANPHEDMVSEFYKRRGLPNFFKKASLGKPLQIGYIGGSITHTGERYRTQTTSFIKKLLPACKITEITAGVPGTDSDLGACRIEEQLLVHKPDLVFVEFAVNGGFDAGVEGIVRKIWRNDAMTDICFIYAVTSAQIRYYQQGQATPVIKRLEQIASHYQIPSVHMGVLPAKLVSENKLIPQAGGDDGDRIAFSKDGIHPLKKGGDLYAESISNLLKATVNDNTGTYAHPLPDALIHNNWEDAKMLDPQDAAIFSEHWVKMPLITSKSLYPYAEWFPYVMKAAKPGDAFTIKFKGNMIGFFDVGGPETGQLEMDIDGKPESVKWQKGGRYTIKNGSEPQINRFNKYCNNRYRGQYAVVNIDPGIHTVTFRVSTQKADKIKILENKLADITENPDRYNQSVIYIGKILLKGELMP